MKPPSIPGLPIRAVEDYHVDRLDVEAPQGVKLTSTNCPIGLNSLRSPVVDLRSSVFLLMTDFLMTDDRITRSGNSAGHPLGVIPAKAGIHLKEFLVL